MHLAGELHFSYEKMEANQFSAFNLDIASLVLRLVSSTLDAYTSVDDDRTRNFLWVPLRHRGIYVLGRRFSWASVR